MGIQTLISVQPPEMVLLKQKLVIFVIFRVSYCPGFFLPFYPFKNSQVLPASPLFWEEKEKKCRHFIGFGLKKNKSVEQVYSKI